jgi:D-lactate dehydrogenase
MLTGKYEVLFEHLAPVIETSRIYHDPLYTLAFGTDASFYRLIPRMVIIVKNEIEVSAVLKECSKLSVTVTFRAAGTSLSGQAVTDSVLMIASGHWKRFSINDDGTEISLQPGITGGKANALLAPYGRKIGPDPASVNAAMIGGIAANNASGMCCGTSENSYKTMSGIRIILADGTILDTRDESSKKQFAESHPGFISEIKNLAGLTLNNNELSARIRR